MKEAQKQLNNHVRKKPFIRLHFQFTATKYKNCPIRKDWAGFVMESSHTVVAGYFILFDHTRNTTSSNLNVIPDIVG